MNRRKFLRNSALFSAPLFFNGVPVFAGNGVTHPWLQNLAKSTNYCNKILIIVQLNGGNDGLNMVIPIDKYTELNNARSSLVIPSSSVLSLNNLGSSGTSTTTGLHPSMTGIQSLYNAGKIVLMQGVSYPNPNYSHFQAQDIWFSSPLSPTTGTLPPDPLDTGWLGRTLDTTYPGFPNGYPTPNYPDPLAIQIGGALPLLIQGANINMGYNVPNPSTLINIANATTAAAPVSDYGTELTFVRMMKDQSNAYTARISASYNAQATQSTQYATSGNTLSDQLKVVARLIGGGLTTNIYIVNHPDSFDTHVNQVGSSTTVGYHADILGKLSVAISAFMDDITLMGKSSLVTGMTFSEFGRRVISNASVGTDHGAAAPIILFGAALHGGIIGTSPNLPTTSTVNTQVPTQFDFRQVYTTILQRWMCMNAGQAQSILNTTNATNVAFSNIFANSPLPIEQIDITAAWDGNMGVVDFVPQTNEQYQSYRVERSADGANFVIAGTVNYQSISGPATYRFIEERASDPKVFYRICGQLTSGATVFSDVVELTNGAKAQAISVYPNPVTNYTIHIDFMNEVTEMVDVAIYDMLGNRVYYNGMQVTDKRLLFKVPDILGPFTPYVLRVRWGTNDVKEQISFL